MHCEAVQFVFLLQFLGNLLMSLKTVQISLTLFGDFFKKSQAHLAQAHLELSEVSCSMQRWICRGVRSCLMICGRSWLCVVVCIRRVVSFTIPQANSLETRWNQTH